MDYQIAEENIILFQKWLQEEERSEGTIEKYLRDVRAFRRFLAGESAETRGQRTCEQASEIQNANGSKHEGRSRDDRGDAARTENAAGKLTKDDVTAWKDFLVKSGYAAATINSMLTAVNTFLRFMGWEECRVRPLKRQRNIFSDEKKELTKAEYIRLLSAAKKKKNPRLYFILQTIASTGIRVSELPFITAESLKTGRSEVDCKGKRRVIILTKKLCRMLRRYCSLNSIDQGPVFVTKSGQPVNRSNLWSEMKQLCEAANVSAKKVFPHNLRHLFARTFYRVEKDIAKLADLLGHTSIETTRIYLMESGAEHEKRVARLGLVV